LRERGAYALVLTGNFDVGLPPTVASLSASALAMAAGGLFGEPEIDEMREQIAALHLEERSGEA